MIDVKHWGYAELDLDDFKPTKPPKPVVDRLEMRWDQPGWRYRTAKGIKFCRATHRNKAGCWLTWMQVGLGAPSHVRAWDTRKDAMEYVQWSWREALKPRKECRLKLPI